VGKRDCGGKGWLRDAEIHPVERVPWSGPGRGPSLSCLFAKCRQGGGIPIKTCCQRAYHGTKRKCKILPSIPMCRCYQVIDHVTGDRYRLVLLAGLSWLGLVGLEWTWGGVPACRDGARDVGVPTHAWLGFCRRDLDGKSISNSKPAFHHLSGDEDNEILSSFGWLRVRAYNLEVKTHPISA